MGQRRSGADEAFQAFMRRVWREDVAPLLKGRYAAQRRVTARAGGTLAGLSGLVVDRLLRLRGRPFARAATVLGARLGALLPDAWDWAWLGGRAGRKTQELVAERVRARAEQLADEEALALLGLEATASLEQTKAAWRSASLRWHPDRAAGEAERAEYRLRFIACKAAYERLVAAYEQGRLPVRTEGSARERSAPGE